MPTRPAILRDERVLSLLAQLAVAVLALAAVGYGVNTVLADMQARGLVPGLDFLTQAAGFGIGEGPAFSESDPYWRAFYVGLINTLRVSAAGVALASVLGLVVALARISGNPIAEPVARGYIELFRNTPVLVQLIFWYRAVILRLPSVGQAAAVAPTLGAEDEALAFLSQRGLAIAWPTASEHAATWLVLALLALGLVLVAARRQAAGRAPTEPEEGVGTGVLALVVGLGALGAAWLWLDPFALDLPRRARFRYEGGYTLTPEFAALLIGLTAYTAAFIAEVIRSGIQSVSRGQREAALAVGLRERQVLRLIVLPQALRVIVPPLTSQYLNLLKNSSLAIYIGFQDVFNIGLTVGNQTGQFVVVIALIMAFYLAVSLLTSLVMNLYARHIKLVEQ